MNRFKLVVIGLAFLAMSLIIYPFVIDHIWQPLYDQANVLVPDMPDFYDFIWRMLPWGILFILFLIALLIILGKAKNPWGGDDDHSEGGEDGE